MVKLLVRRVLAQNSRISKKTLLSLVPSHHQKQHVDLQKKSQLRQDDYDIQEVTAFPGVREISEGIVTESVLLQPLRDPVITSVKEYNGVFLSNWMIDARSRVLVHQEPRLKKRSLITLRAFH